MMWTKLRLLFLFLFFISLDQYIKFSVVRYFELGHTEDSFAYLTYYQNHGIAFGIPFGGYLLIVSVIVVVGYLLWFYRRQFSKPLVQLALVMVLSGAFGNFIDRIFRGHVVDYVAISFFPIFNMADVLIVAGVVLLFVHELDIYQA